ncbi:MAG: tRNA (adenosine(37)-N6)-threonylcarbamoyltransferase complex dimerization subunit type 1 TsaB [Anaerolineae bacterium]|nr:tRNA (adenosine(37)-N6)-threonylcarbamoyltransferase complex dimerization subunit type 1 TsaB [Thermoflexus sp.]MDW8064697.1 tRNA (adenosine(37)-N6)-threonylcarbamoyltransferase complex dimerization subunit type 1 TsaB [Anaerolineae bacterium]
MNGKRGYLLALDTATLGLAIALFDGVEWAAVIYWRTADRHTAELMPRCQELMAQVGLTPADLIAVAVVSGPGSFTGLRAGIAAAKGIAMALDCPLFGIATEEATLADLPPWMETLYVLLPAGRGRLALRRYEWSGAWRPVGEPTLTTAERLIASWTPGIWLVGEWTAQDHIRLAQPSAVPWLIQRSGPSRVMGAARLAWARYQAGERPDPALLRPVYLRTSSVPEE